MITKTNPFSTIGKFFKMWPVILAIVFGLIVIRSTVFTVQYGNVGVLTRFGRVSGAALEPGIHVKVPFVDKVLIYSTQKMIYETSEEGSVTNADYQDYPVDTTTKDGQQVSIRYTVRFSVDADKVKFVAENLGTEAQLVEKVVKTDSRIHARTIPRNYNALDLYSGNVEVVQEKIYDSLKPIFEENGLILDEFGIRSINFQADYVETMEQKQIEFEKVKTEEYRAEQETYKKQALITKAEGEAEAQRLQQETLTKELIQKLYIEKWNGILPTVVSGDNGLILDIGSME